jgi:pyruvate ferredoxin oxidoreductase beta subunit
MPNNQQLTTNNQLAPGHRTCPGCGLPLAVRQILAATDEPVIVVSATGCLEICTTAFPETSWRVPFIHSLFENTAAVASGIEAAICALRRKHKLKKRPKVLAIAGDGGTYDIGLQALSGAVERGHDFVFVCLDNEGYMNTGYQRSSASPFGATTTTTPGGKETKRKDILQIMAAHQITYAAQSTPAHSADLKMKAQKAFQVKGPAFLNVFSPCPTNWKAAPALGLQICRAAVETNFWPLMEFEDQKWKLNFSLLERQPIERFLAGQKRFAKVLKDAELLRKFQDEVDDKFKALGL